MDGIPVNQNQFGQSYIAEQLIRNKNLQNGNTNTIMNLNNQNEKRFREQQLQQQ